MRLRVTALVTVCLLATVALAATYNITFSAGQDTVIQTQLIPLVNSQKCLRFGLPTNCTSANLVTAGCVTAALTKTAFEACTIYTTDVSGETALNQDELSYHYLDKFKVLNAQNAISFQQACKLDAVSTATNAQCAAVSLSNGCARGDVDCVLHGLSAGCNPCP